MTICECILSDDTLQHLNTVQKILQKNFSLSSRSDTLELLLRYIVSDIDEIPVNDLALVDDYFLEHPSFLRIFYNDIMMSATFHSGSYCN